MTRDAAKAWNGLERALSTALFAFMTFANSLGGGFRELWSVVLRPLPVLVTSGFYMW